MKINVEAIRKKIINDIRYYVYSNELPTKPKHSDTYLVEFPKSGITWLTFILANINKLKSGIQQEINFFNIHDFMPDIHQSRFIEEYNYTFPGFRFIKSHSEWNPYYTKVIYLVRNPIDVMVSYYNFHRQLAGYKGEFSDFIRCKYMGLNAWVRHVRNWLEGSPATISFQMVKYEDLRASTENTIRDLFNTMGIHVEDLYISQSVASSSLEHMQQIEREYRQGGRPHLQEFVFVGKEGKRFLKKQIEEKDMEYFADKVRPLNYLGYGYD